VRQHASVYLWLLRSCSHFLTCVCNFQAPASPSTERSVEGTEIGEIISVLRGLTGWENKRKAVATSIGKGSAQATQEETDRLPAPAHLSTEHAEGT
jgi:hypothetical protein